MLNFESMEAIYFHCYAVEFVDSCLLLILIFLGHFTYVDSYESGDLTSHLQSSEVEVLLSKLLLFK